MKQRINWIIFLNIIVIILILLVIYIHYYTNNKPVEIEIVVSRYNEKLDWLNNAEFAKHAAIVYNKGPNDDFTKAVNINKVIKLPNVGREAHTYLHHIINNYYNLADVTVFLPGSNNDQRKMSKSTDLMKALETHKDTVFVGHRLKDLKQIDYYKTYTGWSSSNPENSNINPENKLEPAKIQPFGKWHEEMFPNVYNTTTTGFAILAIARHDIIQHPIQYYKTLIKELETSSNPEVGHYFERAWFSVFYPYRNYLHIEKDW
jgi:hypothetical protein